MTEDKMGPVVLDALSEMGNISMGAAATALSSIAGTGVRITTPKVEVSSWAEIRSSFPMPIVLVEVEYSGGVSGTNLLLMKEEDARKIVGHMMGSAEPPEVLDEVSLSAIAEAMNQMMGNAATSLSDLFKAGVSLDPPRVRMLDGHAPESESQYEDIDSLVAIGFRFTIDGLLESTILQIIPSDAAIRIAETLIQSYGSTDPAPHRAVDTTPAAERGDPGDNGSLDPVRGVLVKLRVVLGGMCLTLGEMRSLNTTDILRLDAKAGQPAAIMIGNQRIGWGEVVCLNGRYGLKVVSLSSQMPEVEEEDPRPSTVALTRDLRG